MCTEEEVLPFSATRSKSSYPTLLLQCSIHFYYLIYFLKLKKSFLFPFASHLTLLQNSLEAMGVQEIKNRTENKSQPISYMGSHLCPSSVSSQSEIFVHKSNSSKNEYLPKVRKPYTIKRQREKWTEEEHQKFLEALKLHGRGWRHIEEHIGTKTAVQIRSHAQKFFSKVARGTDCETDGSLSSIEIPPPRPKKKPMHPYPRKIVDLLLKDLAVLNQPERSFSTDLLQTSILPTISSNTYSPAISELHNGCLSPNSCATDALSANLFPTEKDNECMTSGSIPDNNTSCSLSIKLFGKMVLVPDSRKPSSETTVEGDLDFLLGQRLLDDEQKAGGSSTGSSSGSVSDMGHGQKKSNAVESQHRPDFELRGHVQGFFPYERCVAEGDTNLVNIFEESDGQKIYVCS